MYQDITEYVTNCQQCHVIKGHYIGPHTQQGSLVPHYPQDLLCIDILEIDPSKDHKENVLVLTNASPISVRPLLPTIKRHLPSLRS